MKTLNLPEAVSEKQFTEKKKRKIRSG